MKISNFTLKMAHRTLHDALELDKEKKNMLCQGSNSTVYLKIFSL